MSLFFFVMLKQMEREVLYGVWVFIGSRQLMLVISLLLLIRMKMTLLLLLMSQFHFYIALKLLRTKYEEVWKIVRKINFVPHVQVLFDKIYPWVILSFLMHAMLLFLYWPLAPCIININLLSTAFFSSFLNCSNFNLTQSCFLLP